MEYIMLSYSTMACFYSISMIIIGGFFLLNLLMTVIESKFSKISKEKKQEQEKALDKQPKNNDFVDYWYLKEEEKKKREQAEKELRAKVLKKWQMIIFIKQRMKLRVKEFRLKKT